MKGTFSPSIWVLISVASRPSVKGHPCSKAKVRNLLGQT